MSDINLSYEELLLGAYELLTTYVSSYESGAKGEPVTDIAEIGKCLNDFALDYFGGDNVKGTINFIEKKFGEIHNYSCTIEEFMKNFDDVIEKIADRLEMARLSTRDIETEEGEQS